jgi:hypothetical protein
MAQFVLILNTNLKIDYVLILSSNTLRLLKIFLNPGVELPSSLKVRGSVKCLLSRGLNQIRGILKSISKRIGKSDYIVV